jgi:ankyrin repeat protein
MVAASFASADVVAALLDGGADPNAGNPQNLMAEPLNYAANWNNVPALELLLDAGADIDAVDLGNSTALLYAAQSGNLEAVECLLSHGADPSIRDTDHDSTPRDWAAFHGDQEIVDAIDAAVGEP